MKIKINTSIKIIRFTHSFWKQKQQKKINKENLSTIRQQENISCAAAAVAVGCCRMAYRARCIYLALYLWVWKISFFLFLCFFSMRYTTHLHKTLTFSVTSRSYKPCYTVKIGIQFIISYQAWIFFFLVVISLLFSLIWLYILIDWLD